MKKITSVASLPIDVVPDVPAFSLSPIVLVKVISPSPEDAFTLRLPRELPAPIEPVKVTFPSPEVMVKLSFPPPFVSTLAPKVTPPEPLPVSIVVVPLFERVTSEVLNAIAVFVVVKVGAVPEITMLLPPEAPL